jgi:Catalytic LigB subunit of aromatic ring-opening dioxygenase
MARIVLGLGASHTPLLTLDSAQWAHRAAVDYANPKLNLSDGRWLNYAELLAEVGPRYEAVITPETLDRKAQVCSAALDRLADTLAAANPDVVIIIGDDQAELFSPSNQPVIALFHGEEIITSDKYGHDESPDWVRTMGRGYLMDESHRLPGAPALAIELIQGLMDEGIDVATLADVKDPKTSGFGHAYGFIIKRLLRGRRIPVVPVLLNTYYPPNVPSAARVHDMGLALAHAIARSPQDLRIAVVASGGLSHFVVDEGLDRKVLAAFLEKDASALRAIPRSALQSGSSEILNWIMTAAVVDALPLSWREYQPLYRTAAGTGVGAAFAIWQDPIS